MQIFVCKLSPRSITCSKSNIFNNMGSNFLFPQCPGHLYWQFLLDQKLASPTNYSLKNYRVTFKIPVNSSQSVGSQFTWGEINKQLPLPCPLPFLGSCKTLHGARSSPLWIEGGRAWALTSVPVLGFRAEEGFFSSSPGLKVRRG